MPFTVNQIICPLSADEEYAKNKALRLAGLSEKNTASIKVFKESLDARKGREIRFVYSFVIALDSEADERAAACKCGGIYFSDEAPVIKPTLSKNKKIIIAGFGPAGIFAALTLCKSGYKPIVLERGPCMEERISAVEGFFGGGAFNSCANVQFGEGGAGTFSDGKLTTRIKDPLARLVTKEFVRFGADSNILFSAKPHIGTDDIRKIVVRMRKEIERLGGQVLFDSPLDGITIENGRVKSVRSKNREFETDKLILAIGHSARDTFELLLNKGVIIEPKAFSVGARIEHLQSDVDISLYGKLAGDKRLPKGEYQLSKRFPDKSAAYTFCMCPGGYVVAASSEDGGVLTNGMSYHARDGKNANAAVAVSVSPDDFGTNPLDGVEYQRRIERRAFSLTGGYRAPCMSVKGFMAGDRNIKSKVEPTYPIGVENVDLNELFDKRITDRLRLGLADFSKKMKCFGGGVLTAPETRTSSPVRLTRNDDMTALGIENLYPTGEGAGYAGGIMSAAVDGIKAAIKIMECRN